MRLIILALLALAIQAPPALSQGADFSWDGQMEPGSWLYIRNLNGPVRVEAASGDRAEVRAVKREGRRGDPEDVRIEMRNVSGGGVIICAFWSENVTCDEDGYRSRRGGDRNRNNDTKVEFTVRLPRGVKLAASTVNGEMRVSGATSQVNTSTVNGDVDAMSSGGPVTASTVNGDIDVRMREAGSEDLEYTTVNGSITIEVPATLNADLDMRTVNGSLSSDFPITLRGRVNPHSLKATIGDGGRRLKLQTVNGSITLSKAGD